MTGGIVPAAEAGLYAYLLWCVELVEREWDRAGGAPTVAVSGAGLVDASELLSGYDTPSLVVAVTAALANLFGRIAAGEVAEAGVEYAGVLVARAELERRFADAHLRRESEFADDVEGMLADREGDE